ncbi:S41 family peptidase [Flavobacterium sp. 245]|uniref:S41 family peptidase n=1 Tax=Flavobacterium sp. 245 TaxID=2512115 RepID=UPI00105D77BB|nr:S41 family peptidase [Flavobacterium sp. 245]TDO99105.1 C-terminal processing protease CtpA/Prc [Flavobacterium sp. 245]
MNRKFVFTITCCLCLILQTISQEKSPINNTEKYKQFGLVWGLMKYHHSEISKGKYNWDEKFVENFSTLEAINTQENLNQLLLNFILSVEPSKIKKANDTNDLFKKNLDYDWIETYASNEKLYNSLKQLKENAIISDYYVSNKSLTKIPTFQNEKGFKSFDYKIKSHRLLELFSFWNAIQYHYVNKYLMDKNWLSQLDYFVDDFSNGTNQLKYELAKTRLIVALNDSHSYYFAKPVVDSILKFKPPFGVNRVNDTLVISWVLNKLAKKDDLKLGDLIVEVDGMDIKSFSKQKISALFSSSNDAYLKKWDERWLMMNTKDSVKVKIKRENSVTFKYIHLYKTIEDKDYSSLPFFRIEKEWQLIDNNIGYINLKTISKDQIKKAFEEFSTTDGIIIDLRNYPKNISGDDVAQYIYPEREKFIKVLFAMVNRPSLANYDEPSISIIKDPFKSGSSNSKYYNKKIILLVNHYTQSKAEFIGMAIQASPNCFTVGEQTAGSVLNIAVFKMPDGTDVSFTSMGAFYPDGTSAQRKGLKIDSFVKENTSNFIMDQYIIEGIKQIKSKSL